MINFYKRDGGKVERDFENKIYESRDATFIDQLISKSALT